MNNLTTQKLPVLRINADAVLPDNAQWTKRFEIHSQTSDLREKGFNLAPGIGPKGSKSDWWLIDVTCDKQGERVAGKRRARSFYYKQRRQVTCPIHGEFIQETEESSL